MKLFHTQQNIQNKRNEMCTVDRCRYSIHCVRTYNMHEEIYIVMYVNIYLGTEINFCMTHLISMHLTERGRARTDKHSKYI